MKSLDEIRGEVSVRVQAATDQTVPSVLARAVQPALYLRSSPDPRPGQSHCGGGPCGVRVWPGSGGEPMLFLLAVRLSECFVLDGDAALPAQGWLNFFIAPEVTMGAAALDACAVVYVPDESASMTPVPAGTLCSPHLGVDFERGIHSVPQAEEFGDGSAYDEAFLEWESLGFDALEARVEALQDADYLLGKSIYGTAAGLELSQDASAFAREHHGYVQPCLRALLTLRADSGVWTFFRGNSLLSLTFLIEVSDLRAGQFGRAMVDTTSD